MTKLWIVALVAVGVTFGAVSVASAQEETAPAATEEGGAAAKAPAESLNKGLIALATGLTIAIAAFGGAFGQGKAAVAALEGIARNPGARKDLFVPFILALALIESLVIYALIIAFMLGGKVV
ncbi:MAG: ATP synthase F0 subunit C [Acidobacteria bacterium]|nr:ATP synthase F0 subunit C [Acidobacteriota bacterium]